MVQDTKSPFRWFKVFTSWTGAVIFSLVLNLAFFSLLPQLIAKTPEKSDHPESFSMVNVIRIKRKEVPPKKKEIKKFEKQNEPRKELLRKPVLHHKLVKKLPKLHFELSSKLPAGPGTLPTYPMEMAALDLSGLKEIYGVGELDGPLTPLAQVPPVYPLRAKRMGIQGWVKVKFLVTEQGLVDQIEIIESEPEKIFDQSVFRCVSLWRFKPGTVQGEAVKTWVKTTIRFKLES